MAAHSGSACRPLRFTAILRPSDAEPHGRQHLRVCTSRAGLDRVGRLRFLPGDIASVEDGHESSHPGASKASPTSGGATTSPSPAGTAGIDAVGGAIAAVYSGHVPDAATGRDRPAGTRRSAPAPTLGR